MKLEINEDTFEELVLVYLKDLHHFAEEAVEMAEHPDDVVAWTKIRDHSKGLMEANWPFIKL